MSNLLRRVQSNNTEVNNKYSVYGFNQNPFPVDPAVKPLSDDKRENGSIFLTDLRRDEIKEFTDNFIGKQMKIGFLMDYATYRGRGIGKTAFLNYMKKEINSDLGDKISNGKEVLYAIYVSPTSEKKDRTMPLIARNIFVSMCESDLFLTVFSRLRAFSGKIQEQVLDEVTDDYRTTIADDKWLYDHHIDVNQLNSEVSKKLQGIGFDIQFEDMTLFHQTNSYAKFLDAIRLNTKDYYWQKEGCNYLFSKIVRILQLADFTHCIILLDEVEKIVTYQNLSERRSFCDGLRNYFIDGTSVNALTGFFKVMLTIHPNSQELLMPHWKAAGLDRFSELGGTTANSNTVFFKPLNQDDAEMTLKLTRIYLNNARETESDSISPFTKDALLTAMYHADNIPGKFLKSLYIAIEKGIEEKWQTIDVDQINSLWESKKGKEELSSMTELPETKIQL